MLNNSSAYKYFNAAIGFQDSAEKIMVANGFLNINNKDDLDALAAAHPQLYKDFANSGADLSNVLGANYYHQPNIQVSIQEGLIYLNSFNIATVDDTASRNQAFRMAQIGYGEELARQSGLDNYNLWHPGPNRDPSLYYTAESGLGKDFARGYQFYTGILEYTNDGMLKNLSPDNLAAFQQGVTTVERGAFVATSALGGFGNDQITMWDTYRLSRTDSATTLSSSSPILNTAGQTVQMYADATTGTVELWRRDDGRFIFVDPKSGEVVIPSSDRSQAIGTLVKDVALIATVLQPELAPELGALMPTAMKWGVGISVGMNTATNIWTGKDPFDNTLEAVGNGILYGRAFAISPLAGSIYGVYSTGEAGIQLGPQAPAWWNNSMPYDQRKQWEAAVGSTLFMAGLQGYFTIKDPAAMVAPFGQFPQVPVRGDPLGAGGTGDLALNRPENLPSLDPLKIDISQADLAGASSMGSQKPVSPIADIPAPRVDVSGQLPNTPVETASGPVQMPRSPATADSTPVTQPGNNTNLATLLGENAANLGLRNAEAAGTTFSNDANAAAAARVNAADAFIRAQQNAGTAIEPKLPAPASPEGQGPANLRLPEQPQQSAGLTPKPDTQAALTPPEGNLLSLRSLEQPQDLAGLSKPNTQPIETPTTSVQPEGNPLNLRMQEPQTAAASLKGDPQAGEAQAKFADAEIKAPSEPGQEVAKTAEGPAKTGDEPGKTAEERGKAGEEPIKTAQERAAPPEKAGGGKQPENAVADNCCFVAGTPIKTEAGHTPIEALKVGDLVQSEDPKTGVISLRHVTHVFIRPVDKIKTFYKLSLGKDGAAEDFYVTGEHPFWVVDKAAWKTVGELGVGDTLVDFGGHRLQVSAKTELREKQQTYNITVEGTETYFAGNSEVLVHNCNLPDGYTHDGGKIWDQDGKPVKFAGTKGDQLVFEKLGPNGKPTGEYYYEAQGRRVAVESGDAGVKWSKSPETELASLLKTQEQAAKGEAQPVSKAQAERNRITEEYGSKASNNAALEAALDKVGVSEFTKAMARFREAESGTFSKLSPEAIRETLLKTKDLTDAQVQRGLARSIKEANAELDRIGELRKVTDPEKYAESIAKDKLYDARLKETAKWLADEKQLAADLEVARQSKQSFNEMKNGEPTTGERKPLSFESYQQYHQFQGEFSRVIDGLRVGGKPITAQAQTIGTATSFYSKNPSKGNPSEGDRHHFDKSFAKTGYTDATKRSDVDIDLFSPELVRYMAKLENTPENPLVNNIVMVAGEKTIFKSSRLYEQFPELGEFVARWSDILGRDVDIKLKVELTPIDEVSTPTEGPIEFFRKERTK